MRAVCLLGALLVCCRGLGATLEEHAISIQPLASFRVSCQPTDKPESYYLDYRLLPTLLTALNAESAYRALPAYKVVTFSYAFAGVSQKRIPVSFKGPREEALVITFGCVSESKHPFVIKALWEGALIRFFSLPASAEQRLDYPCDYAPLPSLLEVPKERWEAVFDTLQREERFRDYAQSVGSLELVFTQGEARWHWIGGGTYQAYGIPMGLASGCQCVQRLYSAWESGIWLDTIGDCESLRGCARYEQETHRREVERGCQQVDPRFLRDRRGQRLHLKPGLFLGLGGSYELFWDADFSTHTAPHALL